MNKIHRQLFVTLFIAIFLVSILSYNTRAANPLSGVNEELSDIPTDPSDIKDTIAERYLKLEWSNYLSKVPVIGDIHTFFSNNQSIFKILFNTNYEFSIRFILYFLLWIYFAAIIGDLLNTKNETKNPLGFIVHIKNPYLAFLVGILISIILSWINLFNLITNNVLKLLFSPETWWVRIILWIGFIAILIVLRENVFKVIKAKIEQRSKEKIEKETLDKLKQHDEFIKGVKEGQQIKKDAGLEDKSIDIR